MTNAAEQVAANAVENGTGVVDEAQEAIKTVAPITSQLGQGFLGLSVAATAATFAFRRFKQAWDAKP